MLPLSGPHPESVESRAGFLISSAYALVQWRSLVLITHCQGLGAMMDYTPTHQSIEDDMPRMTITLSRERQRALKEAAARRGTTITAIIDESLELAGIGGAETAWDILGRARANSGLTEEEATALALEVTAAVRAERR